MESVNSQLMAASRAAGSFSPILRILADTLSGNNKHSLNRVLGAARQVVSDPKEYLKGQAMASGNPLPANWEPDPKELGALIRVKDLLGQYNLTPITKTPDLSSTVAVPPASPTRRNIVGRIDPSVLAQRMDKGGRRGG